MCNEDYKKHLFFSALIILIIFEQILIFIKAYLY